jgi:GNAT superfamily N-acetyltransferase
MTVIRTTREDDAPALPAIERSAGMLFGTRPDLAWIADAGDRTVEWHLRLIAKRACWVAVDDSDQPVAFLSAEVQDEALHIWEFAVRLDRQRSGVGRAMLFVGIEDARRRGLAALTLTTFHNVIWNAPFYEKLGFRTLPLAETDARLHAILAAEAEQGLPLSQRCAMSLALV